MNELTLTEVLEVSGGKFKLHFNIFELIFATIGAGLLGGPAGAGMVIAAAIASQGANQLNDMYKDEFGNRVNQ
jgi:hypothetical protein